MTHRLLALLVCFLFATQALAIVPSILAAAGTPHAVVTRAHCAEMSTQQTQIRHCPQCQDLATSSGGCAAYCTVAMPTVPLTVLASAATSESPVTRVLMLLTRSDIPPIPPPIG